MGNDCRVLSPSEEVALGLPGPTGCGVCRPVFSSLSLSEAPSSCTQPTNNKPAWRGDGHGMERPHCQDFSVSVTAKTLLTHTVGPPQCSYGLAPRNVWTCGFTLSVGSTGFCTCEAVRGAVASSAWVEQFRQQRPTTSSPSSSLLAPRVGHGAVWRPGPRQAAEDEAAARAWRPARATQCEVLFARQEAATQQVR